MLKRIIAVALLAALPIMVEAVDEPPQVILPVGGDHTLAIHGNALDILPGPEGIAYLHFLNGVVIEGDGFTIHAGLVELDVLTGQSIDLRSIKFPEAPEDPQRIVRDPGRTIAGMAREMKLPQTDFSQTSVQRVGAGGGVTVSTENITLTTQQLVSTDGGETWAAESRSTLSISDPETGGAAQISADYLLYDMAGKRMLARGNIITQRIAADEPSLYAEAQRYELDLSAGQMFAGEGLKIFSGDYVLCCGRISVDIEQETVVVSDNPHVMDSVTGRTLDAGTISTDLNGTYAIASGNVQFLDPVNGLSLDAAEVRADLEAGVLVAEGNPELRYGGSTYSGSSITVTMLEDDRVVIEVEGPQQARIDLDGFEPPVQEVQSP